MAGSKLSAKTEQITPLGSDHTYSLLAALADRRMYRGNNNLLPEGYMVNGKISVAVSSNNITLTLQTLDGANPSATNPVSVWIAGSFRQCTAALSVTKNAGTNYASRGGQGEQDWFAYLIWNTTPATDIMDIGFSPVPYGRVYSDFSSTATASNYLAQGNASAPNAADSCVVIGRFAATVGAAASYNWSVPTFTNANLIQYPIYNSRILTWVPTLTGFSSDPTNTAYRYMVDGNLCRIVQFRQATAGTSNATGFTATLPLTAKTVTNAVWLMPAVATDNGTDLTSFASAQIASAGSVITLYKDPSGAAWTGSGNKRATIACPLEYEI